MTNSHKFQEFGTKLYIQSDFLQGRIPDSLCNRRILEQTQVFGAQRCVVLEKLGSSKEGVRLLKEFFTSDLWSIVFSCLVGMLSYSPDEVCEIFTGLNRNNFLAACSLIPYVFHQLEYQVPSSHYNSQGPLQSSYFPSLS